MSNKEYDPDAYAAGRVAGARLMSADIRAEVQWLRDREHGCAPDERIGDGSVDTLDWVLGTIAEIDARAAQIEAQAQGGEHGQANSGS